MAIKAPLTAIIFNDIAPLQTEIFSSEHNGFIEQVLISSVMSYSTKLSA
jgi:hypothetical protein